VFSRREKCDVVDHRGFVFRSSRRRCGRSRRRGRSESFRRRVPERRRDLLAFGRPARVLHEEYFDELMLVSMLEFVL